MHEDITFELVSSDSVTRVTGSDNRIWVKLEQIEPNPLVEKATVFDLYQAWAAAASGRSPWGFRPTACPVQFMGNMVRIELGFYVWPSNPNLNYKLDTTIGTIGAAARASVLREFSHFFNHSDTLEFDYYLNPMLQPLWETGIYNKLGKRVPTPKFDNHNTWMQLEYPVFGAARIKGIANGYRHTLTIMIEKSLWSDPSIPLPSRSSDDTIFWDNLRSGQVNADAIRGLSATVTASWVNLEGEVETTQLTMKIPECVEAVLNYCPEHTARYIVNLCESTSDRNVYYSTCTGEVLDVQDGVDPRRYCRTIYEGDVDPSGWVRGLLNQ